MERDGIGYISPKYSAEDFLQLHLSLNSSRDDWNRAIQIFDDRIRFRYLTPIDNLLKDVIDIEINGFAVMALNCLLVDTFYQFREPDNECHDPKKNRRYEFFLRKNSVVYPEFLTTNFPSDFDTNKAIYFYKDIRCGILHSGQTKNGSQLTYDKNYVVEIFEKDKIRVDVRNFTKIIKDYYNNYVYKLKQGDSLIRESFLKQMKKICRH